MVKEQRRCWKHWPRDPEVLVERLIFLKEEVVVEEGPQGAFLVMVA